MKDEDLEEALPAAHRTNHLLRMRGELVFFRRAVIVGVGLIGGSIGLALKRTGFRRAGLWASAVLRPSIARWNWA